MIIKQLCVPEGFVLKVLLNTEFNATTLSATCKQADIREEDVIGAYVFFGIIVWVPLGAGTNEADFKYEEVFTAFYEKGNDDVLRFVQREYSPCIFPGLWYWMLNQRVHVFQDGQWVHERSDSYFSLPHDGPNPFNHYQTVVIHDGESTSVT